MSMSDRDSENETEGSLPQAEAWASLYSLLSEGLKHPDERFHRAVQSDEFEAELDDYARTLGLDLPDRPDGATVPETVAPFDNQYVRLFEGLDMPFAPPVESVYREWHGGSKSDGLLEGPPAGAMRARYEAIGASPPPSYPADHLALVFEYAGLVARSGDREAYRTFLEERLEWIPAFATLVAEAKADAPFHRWLVAVIEAVVRTAREREGLTEPDPDVVEDMVERAGSQVSSRPQGDWADLAESE